MHNRLVPSLWHRTAALAVLATGLTLGPSDRALAQADRSQSIRIVVGYAPGGGADLLTRLVGQRLGTSLSVPVIVDNMSGAGGNIAAVNVAKAAPNGRTILFAPSAHTMNAALDPNVPYDPIRDFEPITEISRGVSVIVVHPSLGISTLRQLLELAKQKPGGLFYGSAGIGTISHMPVELLKSYAGIDVTHVPYKGAAPYTAAMLSGEVQICVTSMANVLPHIRSGRLIALAVTSRQRVDTLPNVPNTDEAGVPGYEYSYWNGFFAPAGTPPEIVQKLRDHVALSIAAPDITARLKADGYIPVGSTPQEFAARVRADLQTWTKLVKTAGIKVQ